MIYGEPGFGVSVGEIKKCIRCKCCEVGSTLEEIISRHGTVEEFDDAVYKAFCDGFVNPTGYKFTGFEGVITSQHHYLNGCKRYAIQPQLSKEPEKYPEATFLDEGQLVLVKPEKAVVQRGRTGGDRPNPPSRNRI